MNAGSTSAASPRTDGRGAARRITPRELRLTAALYALRKGVLDHVRATGELPAGLGPMGGGDIGLRLLIERRGTDIELTPDEELVLNAILGGGGLPYGCAVLIEDEAARGEGGAEDADDGG